MRTNTPRFYIFCCSHFNYFIVYKFICPCTCAHMHVEARDSRGVSSTTAPTLVSRQGPLNPTLTDLIRLAGQQASGSLLPLPFPCRDYRCISIKKKIKHT